MKFGHQGISRFYRHNIRPWTSRHALKASLIAFSFAALSFLAAGAQQGPHTSKLPGISKITPQYTKQAFSGVIKSLDLKGKLLTVDSVKATDTELFPFTKHEKIEKADGSKASLKDLTPGTTILVYYQEKGGRRSIESITVLESAPSKEEAKKDANPS